MSERSLPDPASDDYPWSSQEEGLLTLWSDRALCYRLLHEAAYKEKSKSLLWFTIPVIILSTVTGTANFGMQSLVPDAYMTVAQSIVGALNLVAGLMTTIQNFLRLSEKTEGHRQSFIGWGQLHRSIYTEMKLDRNKRRSARETLQRFRAEYDRLIAVSPPLPGKVVAEVSDKLRHHVHIILPEECDNLLHTEPYMDDLLAEQLTRTVLNETLPFSRAPSMQANPMFHAGTTTSSSRPDDLASSFAAPDHAGQDALPAAAASAGLVDECKVHIDERP